MAGQNKKIIGLVVNPRKENINPVLESFSTWANKYPDLKFLLCTFNSPYVNKDFPNLEPSAEKKLIKRAKSDPRLLTIPLGLEQHWPGCPSNPWPTGWGAQMAKCWEAC